MRSRFALFAVALAGLIAAACAPEAEPAPTEPTGSTEAGGQAVAADWTPIQPLLTEKCAPCHTQRSMGGVSLASQEGLMKAVAPGDPAGSEIIKSLRGTDGHEIMPKGKDPLAEEEIKQVEEWISALSS